MVKLYLWILRIAECEAYCGPEFAFWIRGANRNTSDSEWVRYSTRSPEFRWNAPKRTVNENRFCLAVLKVRCRIKSSLSPASSRLSCEKFWQIALLSTCTWKNVKSKLLTIIRLNFSRKRRAYPSNEGAVKRGQDEARQKKAGHVQNSQENLEQARKEESFEQNEVLDFWTLTFDMISRSKKK